MPLRKFLKLRIEDRMIETIRRRMAKMQGARRCSDRGVYWAYAAGRGRGGQRSRLAIIRRIASGLLLLMGLSVWHCAWADEQKIAEVVVLGNRTVDDAVILSKVKTRPGAVFSQKYVNEDLKRLYSLGYFTNISVDVSPLGGGLKVAFIVKEKPFLKDVLVEGNKVFKRERILDEMESKINRVLDESRVKSDIEKIRKLYQEKGYYTADIAYKITTDENTGRGILALKIVEGQKLFVKEIQLQGVKAFKAGKIRGLMKTKQKWLFNAGYLKEEELQDDVDRIRAFYVSKGYIDAKVVDVKRLFNPEKTQLTLVLTIEEGRQYTVSSLTFEGNKVFPSEDIKKKLKVVPGTLFIPEIFRQDVKAVEDYYLEKGYIDAKVKVDTNIDYATGKIGLIYRIEEADLSYIEKIDIQGNIITKDHVIRRELAVVPGEKFDGVRVRRSQERLQNLGYFKTVDVDYQSTAKPQRKNLVVTVEEKKTGELSFGAGFSSVDSLIGFAEVSQSNFDWRNWPSFTGAGQKLRLRVEGGPKRQDFMVSFTEPWFLNQRLAAGFDGFYSNLGFLSNKFDEKRLGFDLRVGRPITEFLRGDVIYTLERIDLNIVSDASDELKLEGGNRVVSKATLKLDWDTRNNFFYPTTGQRILLTGDLAGLGGDTHFAKGELRSAFYFPMPWFTNHVFKWASEAGAAEKFGSSPRVPIFDRFFLGGPSNLRGFRFRTAGPKDDQGEPIGGDVKFSTTAEYTFPIVAFLSGAVFYDVGNVYRKFSDIDLHQINSDVGAGVRLKLPIGPIQLDYGFPITVDDETKKGHGQFQFNIGTTF